MTRASPSTRLYAVTLPGGLVATRRSTKTFTHVWRVCGTAPGDELIDMVGFSTSMERAKNAVHRVEGSCRFDSAISVEIVEIKPEHVQAA